MHEKKQFTEEGRALACLYATYLMGWSTEKNTESNNSLQKLLSPLCAMT